MHLHFMFTFFDKVKCGLELQYTRALQKNHEQRDIF